MRVFTWVLALLLVAGSGYAQELTGIWRGTFYNQYDLMLTGAKYRYEVQIKEEGGAVRGVTYSYQTTRFYGKAGAVGKWTPGTKNLILKENKMLDLKIEGGGVGCLMTCYLEYRKDGDKEYLIGTYTSVNMNNDSLNCGGGVVRLERVPDSDFKKEDFLTSTRPLKIPPKTGQTKPGQDAYLVKKTPAPQSGIKPKTAAPKPASGTTAKAAPKPASGTTAKPAPKPASGTTAKAAPKPAAKPATSPAPKTTAPAAGTAAKPQPKPAAGSATAKAPAKPTTPAAKPAPATTSTSKAPGKAIPPAVTSSGQTPATKPANTNPAAKATSPKVLPPAPPALKNRTNELVDVITLRQKDVLVSFYDNGEIDGDTITVYFDNKLLVQRKGLSAQPIEVRLTLADDATDHELVMVAENLGSIPPNTALMIVQAGEQRITLRLSSTEQKNAMVRFRYEGAKP